VEDLDELSRYPFWGHSVIMGKIKRPWQDPEGVMGMFGKNLRAARRAWRLFVEKGIAEGRRRDLTGGGLLGMGRGEGTERGNGISEK
jgi:putative transposase